MKSDQNLEISIEILKSWAEKEDFEDFAWLLTPHKRQTGVWLYLRAEALFMKYAYHNPFDIKLTWFLVSLWLYLAH